MRSTLRFRECPSLDASRIKGLKFPEKPNPLRKSASDNTSALSRILFFALFFAAAFTSGLHAQNFTPGNLAVLLTDANTTNTTATIVEVSPTTNGAVSTFAIPGTGATAMRFSTTATSTGYVSNSNDGSQLIFTGANSTNTSANTNTLNPRGVAVLTATKAFSVATTYTGSSGDQPRSATSLNNTNYYIGDQGGLFTNGTTAASPSGNFRSIKAFGGVAYGFTASASSPAVGTFSATSGGAFAALPGLPNGATTYQDFYMISSGSNGASFDVLYILTTSTILKYSLVGGSWVSNGSAAQSGFGLCAKKQGTGAYLFTTSGTGATTANSLVRMTDTAGYNATIAVASGNNLTLYTAPANRVLKGLAFAPVASSPLTVTGEFAAVNTTYGTASGATSVAVAGTGLSADVLVTPPTGFEVSQTSASTGFAAVQTLAQTSGTLASTTVYIRLKATTAAGTYSGSITFVSGSNSISKTVSNSTVSAKAITVSGATAQNKVYDRLSSATITGATAQGLVNGDVVSVSGSGTFADRFVANGKPVTANLSLSGTNATSYTLTQPTGLTANITAKPVTLASASVANKEYDGSTEAVLTATLSGVISPDEVLLNPSAHFNSPFVGSDIAVTSTSTIFGSDSANYTLAQPGGLSANITAKALTIENAVAQNKIYDGNTNAVITGSLSGVIAPDEVTLSLSGQFASPNVGLDIAVTSTSTISGDVSNYTLSQPTGLKANISAQALQPQTITFDALPNATYGDANFNLNATASSGLQVSYSSSDENVATVSGNVVTIHGVGTTTITASQNGDLTYDMAAAVTQTLTVVEKTLSVSAAVAQNKVYDANTNATITGTLSGLVGNDVVVLNGVGTFASANAANGISVTSVSTISGANASNYVLAQPTGLTANITAKTLSVTNAVAQNKVYDATDAAVIVGGDLVGAINNDDVSLAGFTGTFASVNVGNNIAVTSQFSLTGSAAANYSVAQPAGLKANITALAVDIFGLTAANKVYDGNTSAILSGTPEISGLLGTDDVSVSGTPTAAFVNKNAGTEKAVLVTGYTLSGPQAANYAIVQPSDIFADITPKPITINDSAAVTKNFDGTTAATITGTLNGVISPDVVTLVGTGVFAQSAVGNNIAVTSTSTLGGAAAANYVISPQPTGLTANILAGPSVLSVGDITILGFQLNTPDTFAFATWVDLSANTIIKFTDNAFLSSNSANATGNARGGENFVIWKNNGGVIPAGTVIRISDNAGTAVASTGSIVSGNLDGLSASGDNIFAYQGAAVSGNNPDFSANTNPTTFNGTAIYGIYFQGSSSVSTWMTSGAASSNTSYLPSQLNVANGNIAIANSASRGQYTGSRTNQASFAAYKALVNNTANWTTASGSGTITVDVTPFTLVSGPTASVISGTSTICTGSNATFSVAVTGGTSPYTVVYSDGTNQFTLSGYVSASPVTVTPTATTTYTLVAVTDANAIASTGIGGSSVITVNQKYPFYVDADFDGYGTGNSVPVCAVNAATPPTGYSLNNIDCNDALAAVHPGASEIPFNGIDDDCDGTIDEGSQIYSQVLPNQCGTTLSTISSLVGAVSFGAPVDGYRFRVVNATTGVEQTIDRAYPNFQFTQLANYDYASTYNISVQLKRNGVWLNYYGPVCQISTPAILNQGGAASVNPSQCGIVLPSLSTLIATTSLAGVTAYRFRITDTATNEQQILDRTTNWFSLTLLEHYLYGRTYVVEVSVRTNGAYSGYGQPCEVTSPAVPQIANCGAVIATKGTLISTTSLNRVTSYRFQLTNMTTAQSVTIDRTQNYFSFNSVPSYTPGAQYAVAVAVMTAGSWSDFSEACFITSPGASRNAAQAAGDDATAVVDFRAVLYPNPYSESFAFDMVSSSDEKVSIRVYDMIGKLVENKEFSFETIETQQFGENYPSGVYNVVVTQGGNVKTLRVIKR